MAIKIGLTMAPMYGTYPKMREQWLAAEALGVDSLYSADHFFAHGIGKEYAGDEVRPGATSGTNFEGTTIQTAMAASTTRPEIGCMVHAIGFRNPNLLADIARTIDHVSNGRYILGLGSGYMQGDYEEYGYDWGTTKSRLEDLQRGLPVIKRRLELLNPPPLHKIPIMIGSTGEKVGMRIVAEHADIWHVFGPMDYIAGKIEVMKRHCSDIGRDFDDLELCSWYFPHLLDVEQDPDDFVKLGIRNIINMQYGPEWDLGMVRELLQWRTNREG